MEAYAVAAAALGSGRPRPKYVVVKGICDYADKDKADDYQEYAAEVAAGVLQYAAFALPMLSVR
jgi:nucleoside phosphorylase